MLDVMIDQETERSLGSLDSCDTSSALTFRWVGTPQAAT